MINATALARYNYTLVKPEAINVADVIVDVCRQIDDKVTICLLLIFTFYISKNFILPYARRYFDEYTIYGEVVKPVLDSYGRVSDTLSLLAICFILVLRGVQGLSVGFYVWGGILVGLALFVKIFEFFNERGKK